MQTNTNPERLPLLTTVITVSTKSGEEQHLHFVVYQSHPHPCIDVSLSALCITHDEGIARPESQRRAPEVTYYAALLAHPPAEPIYGYNRTLAAGYKHYPIGSGSNPERLIVRGKGLGCVELRFSASGYCTTTVRDGEQPTGREREVTKEQVEPFLWNFIFYNKDRLHKVAAAAVRERLITEVQKVRASLRVLEEQALAAANYYENDCRPAGH